MLQSCTKKLAHAPAEKTAGDKKTCRQEHKAEHAHCARDIRTVRYSPEEGINGFCYRVILLFGGENEAVADLQHGE